MMNCRRALKRINIHKNQIPMWVSTSVGLWMWFHVLPFVWIVISILRWKLDITFCVTSREIAKVMEIVKRDSVNCHKLIWMWIFRESEFTDPSLVSTIILHNTTTVYLLKQGPRWSFLIFLNIYIECLMRISGQKPFVEKISQFSKTLPFFTIKFREENCLIFREIDYQHPFFLP